MVGNVEAISRPFGEALQFFRAKVDTPTARWADLWHEQHDVGFMVAGAAKADLLADLRGAVDKAIEQGTTIAEFRRDFAAIVERHGWQYKGGFNWRTRVIYDTNLRTAYQAGRYAQLTDPDMLAERPYWLYRHGDSATPRPLHLKWDGTVLPASDPWWQTHYTPNGWGCKCRVFALTPRELERRGLTVSDPPDDGEYTWIDPETGRTVDIPEGIDPGFAYAPGSSVAGRTRDLMQGKVAKLKRQAPKVAQQLAKAVDDAPRAPPTLDEAIDEGQRISDELLDGVDLPPVPGQVDKADELLAEMEFARQFRGRLRERLALEVGIDQAAATQGTATAKGAKLVREASTWFPNSWTVTADAYGPLYVRFSKARGWHITIKHNDPDIGRRGRLPGMGLVTLEKGAGYIVAGKPSTALHEYVHRLQGAMPELDDYFQDLHIRRTRDEAAQSLRALTGYNYSARERAKADGYLNPYMGKEYQGDDVGKAGALEVMTMTYQHLLVDDVSTFAEFYRKDRELFNLAVGLLFGYKP